MGSCHDCMKYAVIYIAVLFMLTGAAIVGLSVYFVLEQDMYMEVTPEDGYGYVVYGVLWILIFCGSIMLIGGITGCLGGFKQSPSLLAAFLVIVLVISLAELIPGVILYFNQDNFFNYFRGQMKNSVQNLYGVDEYRTRGWDLMQRQMQCCGATSFRDYSSNVLQRAKSDGIIDTGNGLPYTVPYSCCDAAFSERHCEAARSISITTSIPRVGNIIYKEGCAEKFVEWIKSKSPYFFGPLIIIGSTQLVCLFLIAILICLYRYRHKDEL